MARTGMVEYELALEPNSTIVYYNDGYIRAPGFIDLSDLTFTAISDPAMDDDGSAGMDGGVTTDDDTPPHSRGHRSTVVRRLDGGMEKDGTDVDIVVFPLPSGCAHSRKGCNWAELGVGIQDDDKVIRWCCDDAAVTLGLCGNDAISFGRLILDLEKFKGERHYITVAHEGPVRKTFRYGQMNETESGMYVVLFANCNEKGREIFVTGETVWKSTHGYLPGELYGFMFFYTFVTVVYFALLVWYGLFMYANEEYRIEIEKWIFFAIALGLLEMIFRSGDYFVWNTSGSRSSLIIWISVLTGVLKQGISRCLLVMVSLGWGVVRDSLGSTMRIVVLLGAVYVGVSSVSDLMIVFAVEDMNKLTQIQEDEIFSAVRFLTLVVAMIDVIFILWILDALNNTMLYLESMNQTRKLDRYLKLRCLFIFSILFACMWVVFSFVDTVNDVGIVAEEHAWAVDAAMEIDYLFVLIGVALLWKPSPNAREYAYVMELPAMVVEGDNELELTGTVPSALDSDDGSDDFSGKNGHNDNGFHDTDGHDGRFQIS